MVQKRLVLRQVGDAAGDISLEIGERLAELPAGHQFAEAMVASWFDTLAKPDLMPPGWAFGVAWTILYLFMALALAMILHARGAKGRGIAVTLFLIQLACNLAWSPLFFGAHEAKLAFYLLLVIFVLATITTILFGRIRKVAAWLMVPYLCWLGFASGLAYDIDRLNPYGGGLVSPGISTQI